MQGHEDILNFVRRRIEDGIYKKYGTARRWSSSIRNEYRNNNSNISNMQYRREKSGNDVIHGRQNRQQSETNIKGINKSSSNNRKKIGNNDILQSKQKSLKNSEKGSFSNGKNIVKESEAEYDINNSFYSQGKKTIAEKMTNKADAQTFNTILNKNGAKQDKPNWLDNYIRSECSRKP